MKQAAFAEAYFGSESLMWQDQFVKLAMYTLSLEKRLKNDGQ